MSNCPTMSLSQLLSYPCWLNEVCEAHSDHGDHSDPSDVEKTGTFMIHTDAIGSRTHLNVWKPFTKRSPEVYLGPGGIKTLEWSLVSLVQVCKSRWQTTSRILDLWSIDLIRLEHVDGEGLPFDYHKHHAFLFPLVYVRSVASQIAYSEDDNANSVALGTSSEAGGTKADQEGLQGHHPENDNRKPWVIIDCPVGARFYSRCIPPDIK